jgi:outer membrane protein TolC
MWKYKLNIVATLVVTLVVSAFLASFAADSLATQSWQRVRRSHEDHPLVKGVEINLGDTTKAAPTYVGGGSIRESDLVRSDLRDKNGVFKLSIDDCVEMALERGVLIKAADMDIDVAKAQLGEASAEFWPIVEYKYRIAPVPTDASDAFNAFFDGQLTMFNSIHVGIGYPLFTFGQLETARKMARGGVKAARYNRLKARQDTIYGVKKIYYGIILAKEMIRLLDEVVGKLSSKIADEVVREDPEMDPYDLIKLKAFNLELERRLQEAENNMALAYEGLRLQLDIEPNAKIVLKSRTLSPVYIDLGKQRQYIDATMEAEPDLKRLDVGVDTKRLQYRLEKFKLLPKVGMGFFIDAGRTVHEVRGVQATDDFNNPFNYTRAGLGLEFRGSLDFHGASQRIKKAKAEYYKATYNRSIARRAKNLEMRKVYLETRRARDNVLRAKKEQSMANQMMFLSRLNIDTGIGDQSRYTESLKAMLVGRGRYFKAVFDYNVAVASLEQRIGKENHAAISPSISEEVFSSSADERNDWGMQYQGETSYGLQQMQDNIEEDFGPGARERDN